MLDAETRRLDVKANIRVEDTMIMLADYTTMVDETRPGS
jgi:hypothetical protein